ncbi:MAG: SAM-dependent methyltransferase [Parachlamydiales bacterium]|jgi:16S rRNA (cytidine1402-2'-O)-methyltransferase
MPLIVLPNLISPESSFATLPADLSEEVVRLAGLIAESEKAARRFLIRFLDRPKANSLPVYLLNEHTEKKALFELFQELKKGLALGLISDAGLPVLADPGADLIFLAQTARPKIPVRVLGCASSLLHALILSGLPAQRFYFAGYLPRQEEALQAKFKELELFSLKNQATVLFIEAPYRNQQLLQRALKTLKDKTTLAKALDLTGAGQDLFLASVKDWKAAPPALDKHPAIFLFYAPPL